jgi:hypothetical protein
MNALEFQVNLRAASAYSDTVLQSLSALDGDGSLIHERNRHSRAISGDLLLANRAAYDACEAGNPKWLNTGAAYTATTWLFRLWNDCDAAVGWMVRLNHGPDQFI